MTLCRTLRVCATLVCCLAAAPAAGQHARSSPPPLEEGRLYLNVGTVDTSRIRDARRQGSSTFESGKAYVIQLTRPITPELRARLRGAGVVIKDYLPKNAYVAALDRATPGALGRLADVAWVGEYQQAWKLDPQLGRRDHRTPQRLSLAERGEIPVIVSLFQGRSALEVTETLTADLGAEVHYTELVSGNETISATMRLEDVAKLAAHPAVQYIEEAPELTLRNDTTRWIIQSNQFNVTPLWDNGLRGLDQIIGILDGKVDRTHCSFEDPVNNTPGPTHRKIVAYNTTFGLDSHGTHVAGTAIGQDFNGATDATRGIAYEGRFVFNDVPTFNQTAMRNALIQHASQGATIHTNSWGDDNTINYNALCRGVDSFSHDHEDELVLFAVTNGSTLKNPENAKNLLAVGASMDWPNQGDFCSGGAGPTADGRRKPEIFAPGCGTNSAFSNTLCGVLAKSGTSMACPAVAGTAMLVRQYYTEGYYPSGSPDIRDAFTPSGALIKATLINAAVDMTGIPNYPSDQEGWGRLLADDALFFTNDVQRLAVFEDIRNASGLTTNQTLSYPLNVLSPTQKLKVTLVWTDYPAGVTTGTGFAAVNDLDLEVETPTGTIYLGNVFSGGLSAIGGAKDDRNNVEQVHLDAPELGIWTIRVHADAVNQGPQGFALIATGDVSDDPLLDLTPPQPDPMSFESFPAPLSTSAVTMLATEAIDVTTPPVQYFFFYDPGTGAGGNTSSWQLTRDYTDVGLDANSSYKYLVRASDSYALPNITDYSPAASATTFIETPTALVQGFTTPESIEVTAPGPFTNLSVLQSGLYFEWEEAATATPVGNTGWAQSMTITATGLTPDTAYTFRIKARNQSGIETTPFESELSTVPGVPCTLLGDVNLDGLVDGADVSGFLRAKFGTPDPGDNPICADYPSATLEGDIASFIADLLETGACCFSDGTCQDGLIQGDCDAAGGSYQGNASDCGTSTCPVVLANDECAGAVPISGQGLFPFDIVGATASAPSLVPPCNGSSAMDNDVWFCWTAACDGLVVLETCGQTTVNTMIAVYDGCACPPLAADLMACSDDECGTQSTLVFLAAAGQPYLIRLGSAPGEPGGAGTFSLTCLGYGRGADNCADAHPIIGEGTFQFDNTNATMDGPDHAACAFSAEPGIDKDIWFCWTATCTDTVTIQTCGLTSVDTKIAVYDGCACPATDVRLLACDDDGCPLHSILSFPAVSGQTYLIRLGIYPGAPGGGAGEFSIRCGPPCPLPGDVNDDGLLNAADVAAFVRVKLGAPNPGDNPWCADYQTGTLEGDVALFITDLLGTGACCFADGSCLNGLKQDDCAAAGGSYLGDASDCETSICLPIPPNDECAGAVPITGQGLFPFDNAGATTSELPLIPPCNGSTTMDHDVWFCWTAACDGLVVLETCGQTTVNTMIAVYDGCACPPLPADVLACSDDDCGAQSTLVFLATAGQPYLIRLGSAPGDPGGAGTFSLACLGYGKGADDCANADPITGEGVFLFDNTNATMDGPDHAACTFAAEPGIDKDVWFCWTATCTNAVRIETCGLTSVDTKIAVYDGCACPVTDVRLLACDDDGCPLHSKVSFSAVSGQTYLIRLGIYPGAPGGGEGEFSIVCGAP